MNFIINPALLIALPLLFAFLAAIHKKLGKPMLIAAASLNTLLALAVVFLGELPMEYWLGGFKPPFGISLVVDEYSALAVILLNVVFALIVIMSFKHVGKYGAVLAVSLAALNGMVLTGDLFNLFVFMEVAAIAAYIITAMDKGYKHTFNYLIVGSLGSGLYLLGIILLYNIFGSLNMSDISMKISLSSYHPAKPLALPVVLIFSGLAVEAKLIPFGGWVKGVLKKSNPLVGAMIASAYALAVLMALGRVMDAVFIMTDAVLIAFTVIAVATLVFAEASAFSKKNLREVLLFSSIAQSGLAVLLFLNNLTAAAVMVIANNVVSKLVMFTIAGKLAHDLGTDEVEGLKGIFSKYVLLGIGFTAAAMSLIGLPVFFGFIAKINALVALFDAGNIWLPIIILIMSVVEGAYFVRILTKLWNPGAEGELSSKEKLQDMKLDGCAKVGIVTAVIALVIIALGTLPIALVKDFMRTDIISVIKQLMGGM